MSLSNRARPVSIAVLVLIAAFLIASCDSEVNQCFGVNLEQSFCPADTVLSIGQEKGLTCIKCTGEDTGDRFSIYWNPALLAGTPDPGTLFGFVNTPDRWLAEFSDCGTINLFETFQNDLGRFVKGESAGALEDLRPFQIDKLSLFINIPGFKTEAATCNYCADSIPPRCFQVIPYY